MKSLSAIWKKVRNGFTAAPERENDNDISRAERRGYRSASSERESRQYNTAPRHHAPAGADGGNMAERQLCSSPLEHQNSIFY